MIRYLLFIIVFISSLSANIPTPFNKQANILGAITNTYDSMSRIITQTNPNRDIIQLDKETGDYYLRARYYSPSSMRLLSRDSYDGTLKNPITQNHYLYANANPLTYTDPNGYVGMQELNFNMAMMGTVRSIVFPQIVGRNIIKS